MNPISLVSGAFDPVHIGHIRMFKYASGIGTLVIGLNSDEWIERNKGRVWMPFEERKEMIESIKWVDKVEGFDDSDNTCIKFIKHWLNIVNGQNGWSSLHFCNGGNRNSLTTPEAKFCKDHSIQLEWATK